MKSVSQRTQVILFVVIIFLLLIPPLIYFATLPFRHHFEAAAQRQSQNLQAIASITESNSDTGRASRAAAVALAGKEAELSGRSFREAQTTTFIIFLIGGFTTALLTTFLLLRRMVGPLISLCSQIQEIANDPSHHGKIEVKGGADFQQISKAFNRHMELLQEKDRQLLHAQQMELTGLLAGGMVHEFNTVLTSVRGFAEYLQKTLPADETLGEVTSHIINAVNRGSHLTRALRPFQREGLIQPEQVDMNLLVQEVKSEHEKLIGHTITIRTELHDTTLWVMGDRYYLQQVLVNIIGNARDAMPDGGVVCIANSLQEVDAVFLRGYGWAVPGTYARISVTDGGIGMDEETVDRIFQPFFTTKELNKGTGLGLTMAYGIIREHKGFISVRSERDRGTEVTLYLPIIEHHAATTL